MPASIDVLRWSGSATSPTKTVLTNSTNRFSVSDDPLPGTNNPIPVPQSGTAYSFWVATRLYSNVGPTNGVNNVRWFSDGASFGTNLLCAGNQATAYVQPTGVTGVSGTVLDTSVALNHYNVGGSSASPLVGNPIDVTTINVNAPLSLTGSLASGQTGDFGNFMVYQLAVGPQAVVGNISVRNFNISYDES